MVLQFEGEFVDQVVGVQEELLALCEILLQVDPNDSGEKDSFRWFANVGGQYATRDGYKAVAKLEL